MKFVSLLRNVHIKRNCYQNSEALLTFFATFLLNKKLTVYLHRQTDGQTDGHRQTDGQTWIRNVLMITRPEM